MAEPGDARHAPRGPPGGADSDSDDESEALTVKTASSVDLEEEGHVDELVDNAFEGRHPQLPSRAAGIVAAWMGVVLGCVTATMPPGSPRSRAGRSVARL